MKLILMSLILFAGLSSNAGLLTLTAGDKRIEGIALNRSAVITGSDVTISLLGAGARSKTTFLFPAKIYVAELFSNSPQTFSRDQNALRSLEQSTVTAVRLTFLRNINVETMISSCQEAFVANFVSLNDQSVEEFLAAVNMGGDIAVGKSIVILMVLSKDGGAKIYFEDVRGRVSVIDGARSLQQKVLSIWLGQPADSGYRKLKESLLKPVY